MWNKVKTNIICPVCGKNLLIREEPEVIKSNTASYSYLCPDCGVVKVIESNEAMQEWIKSLYSPNEKEGDKVMNNKRCSLNCEYFDAEDNGVYRCKKYFVRTALGRECRDGDPHFQPLHEEERIMTENKVCENFGDRNTCPYASMDNILTCISWVPDKLQAADVVNHPSHYETGKFECVDVMRETQGDEAVQNFCICNAQKYIYRHRNKNGVEDIRKAKWYIDKYLEIEEERNGHERDIRMGSEASRD